MNIIQGEEEKVFLCEKKFYYFTEQTLQDIYWLLRKSLLRVKHCIFKRHHIYATRLLYVIKIKYYVISFISKLTNFWNIIVSYKWNTFGQKYSERIVFQKSLSWILNRYSGRDLMFKIFQNNKKGVNLDVPDSFLSSLPLTSWEGTVDKKAMENFLLKHS